MRTCQETTRLVSKSMDRKLPLRQRVALRLHFFMCRFCGRYYLQIRFLQDVMGRYAEKETEDMSGERLPESCREQIREKLKERMNA